MNSLVFELSNCLDSYYKTVYKLIFTEIAGKLQLLLSSITRRMKV